MKRRTALIASLLISAAAVSGCARPGSGGNWVTILDDKTFANWDQIGNGNWRVENGEVVGDKGKAGFLVSRRTYKDFMIRATFWVSDDANSGIFIRGEDQKSMTGKNAYEVNIFDKRPDPTYGTGAIVDTAKAGTVLKTGGKWNEYEITARGDTLTVTLNGVRTVDAVRDGKHTSGYIGIQSDGGVVKFKKVEIRDLSYQMFK